MDNLPGSEFAEQQGYTLQSHSGNKESATYVRHFDDGPVLFLTVKSDQTAVMGRIMGLICCSTGEISLPNRYFSIFQRQLLALKSESEEHAHDIPSSELCCEDCGKPYGCADWIDCNLPDDQWEIIHPDSKGGILCGACIIARAQKLAHAAAIFMHIDLGGDYSKVKRWFELFRNYCESEWGYKMSFEHIGIIWEFLTWLDGKISPPSQAQQEN